jgi:hypothetical protein
MNGEKLVSELEIIGLRPFVKSVDYLNSLVYVSEGIDELLCGMSLLNNYNIEIGAGLVSLQVSLANRLGLFFPTKNSAASMHLKLINDDIIHLKSNLLLL